MINSGHLIWWVRKQLDGDGAVAREAATGYSGRAEWLVADKGTSVGDMTGGIVAYDVSPHARPHIARHDPASVLADVAAKKAIVDRCEEALRGLNERERTLALHVLLDLASAYSGRDGYGGWGT